MYYRIDLRIIDIGWGGETKNNLQYKSNIFLSEEQARAEAKALLQRIDVGDDVLTENGIYHVLLSELEKDLYPSDDYTVIKSTILNCFRLSTKKVMDVIV